jgi:hypothetical protein
MTERQIIVKHYWQPYIASEKTQMKQRNRFAMASIVSEVSLCFRQGFRYHVLEFMLPQADSGTPYCFRFFTLRNRTEIAPEVLLINAMYFCSGLFPFACYDCSFEY